MKNKDKEKITRVEIIDENGRSYSKRNCDYVELSYQDNGKTLKIFINRKYL